jgi:uncharacterized FlaG/YvyC family protein
MYNAKLCALAIACTVGFLGLSSETAAAAENNTEEVTLSERENDQKDKRAAYEDKLAKAHENWNALSKKQKGEIYSLLEAELKAEIKVMDKLAEYGVLEKADAEAIKLLMTENFNKAKEGQEFPFARPRAPKSR